MATMTNEELYKQHRHTLSELGSKYFTFAEMLRKEYNDEFVKIIKEYGKNGLLTFNKDVEVTDKRIDKVKALFLSYEDRGKFSEEERVFFVDINNNTIPYWGVGLSDLYQIGSMLSQKISLLVNSNEKVQAQYP